MIKHLSNQLNPILIQPHKQEPTSDLAAISWSPLTDSPN